MLKSKWKSIIGMSNVYVSICLHGQFYVGMSMWGSLSGWWQSLSGEVFMRKSVWGVYVYLNWISFSNKKLTSMVETVKYVMYMLDLAKFICAKENKVRGAY